MSYSDFQAAYQPPQGEVKVLPDLMDDIDVNSDFDVTGDSAWNKFLSIPFQDIPDEPESEDNIKCKYYIHYLTRKLIIE